MPSYILAIRYPQTLNEYVNMLDKRRFKKNSAGTTDLYLLSDQFVIDTELEPCSTWCCPDEEESEKILFDKDDYIFFYCTKSSKNNINKIFKEMEEDEKMPIEQKKIKNTHLKALYNKWLNRDDLIVESIHGKIFAYGSVLGRYGFVDKSIEGYTHYKHDVYTAINNIIRIYNKNLKEEDGIYKNGISLSLIHVNPESLQKKIYKIINDNEKNCLLNTINNYKI